MRRLARVNLSWIYHSLARTDRVPGEAHTPLLNAYRIKDLEKRWASPQLVPIEVEEAKAVVRPPLELQPEASTSGRSNLGQRGVHERLMYTLYKVRGEAMTKHILRKNRVHQDMDDLLMPLQLITNDSKGVAEEHPFQEAYYRELTIELNALRSMQERVVQEVDKTMKRGGGTELRPSQTLIAQWIGPLTEAIELEQKSILNSIPVHDRKAYGPHLLLLPAHVLANTTLHGFISSVLVSDEIGTIKLSSVQQQVVMDLMKSKAKRVQAQRLLLQKKLQAGEQDLENDNAEWSAEWFKSWRAKLERDPSFKVLDETIVAQELLQRFKELKPYDLPDPADLDLATPLGSSAIVATEDGMEVHIGTRRQLEQAMKSKAGMKESKKLALLNKFLNRCKRAAKNWQQEKVAKIGAKLLQLMLDSCFVAVKDPVSGQLKQVPALKHHIKTLQHGRKQGIISLHEAVIRQFSRLKDVRGLLLPAYQPMVLPPMPWRSYDYGGYLIARSSVMRCRANRAQIQALKEVDEQTPGLGKIYEALNALGELSWRINSEMLDVIEHAYNRSMEICDLPLSHDAPIQPPVKRQRFHVIGGGFWRPHSKDIDFETEHKFMDSLLEKHASETGSLRSNEEAELIAKFDKEEGTYLSRPSHKRRGSFKQTQLLVATSSGETALERLTRRTENEKIRKFNREQYSLRCDLQYKLGVAHKFKSTPKIFFPHNLDFRGRAYPMHPHLNHLGNDLCRGLLEFAEGKPLGKHGLQWLFVQIANTWGQGVDKASFPERRKFVTDNLANVLESARSPFQAKWWQQADEPWQCLAACKDVEKAISSGDPDSHVSHAPVMMDGSCNGLQHYAALGLDHLGGTAVNLTDMSRPQDVYTEVANMVREKVRSDAASGCQQAQLLLNEVDRKLVKQTVMTSVYGVTFVGARDQINNRLKERGFVGSGKNDSFRTANYAARSRASVMQETLDSLHECFGQAKLVMTWLAESARAIAKCGEPVSWMTPLGLPVVQPYRKKAKIFVSTSLQRVVLISEQKQKTAAIAAGRQRSAFPPNFIHSLDSTHMLMTALACKKAGLSFAGVHDSFWTHAASVPELNSILREKFVELYQKPILEDLADSFKKNYPKANIPRLPPKGDLNLEEVLRAQYFFS